MLKQLAPLEENQFAVLCAFVDIARRQVPFTSQAMKEVLFLVDWLSNTTEIENPTEETTRE